MRGTFSRYGKALDSGWLDFVLDFASGALLHQVTFNGNGTAFPAQLEEQLLTTAEARH